MTIRYGGYAFCDGCGIRTAGKDPKIEGWDWFKGYLTKAAHFCPKCQGGDKHKKLFADSRRIEGEGK